MCWDESTLLDGVPLPFRCSLTLELMSNPVIIASGHTFERRAIERWLASNDTCPLSQTALNGNRVLIPNISLKKCIDSWKEHVLSNFIPKVLHNHSHNFYRMRQEN
jgi:hypothetical protein